MTGAIVPFGEMQSMAVTVAKGGLFGVKTEHEALSLMLLSQALGKHPMIAIMEYNIVNGRPAKKAESVLAAFQERGGVVEWLEYTPTRVTGKFWHPKSCPVPVTITWTIEQASKIKSGDKFLTQKDNWINYPAAMLRSRCISEGVRTVDPASLQGTLVVEEAEDLKEVDQNARPVIEAPKKVEIAQKQAQEARTDSNEKIYVEAEIAEPASNVAKSDPKTEVVGKDIADLQPAPAVPAPEKVKLTVPERLANAKKQLGDKEYAKYLKECGLKESEINLDNINIVIRGMRVRFEDLQKKDK